VEQQDLQKRLLLAFVLSFLIFMVFDFFMPKPQTQDINGTQQQKESNENLALNKAPEVAQKEPISSNSGSISSIASKDGKTLALVKSDKFIYTIDNIGRIAQVKLLEDKYKYEGRELELLNPHFIKPLEIRFADEALNKEALSTPYTTNINDLDLNKNESQQLILTQKLSGVTVTKKIRFYIDGHYDLEVNLSEPKQYFITTGQRPDADHTRYMVVNGVMVKKSDGVIEIIEDGDAKGSPIFPSARFTSAFDRYYTTILYRLEKPISVSLLTTKDENAISFVQGEDNFRLHGYIGPKEYETLYSINPELTDAIEYGWFTFIAKPLFNILYWLDKHIGNWGWSIIILTILIKLILFPLSYKGMISMQKLKDLAPKMQEIRERYKDDAQKMNMKIMELYKKHDANPMGGCLPMLLQIPIFFALYRVFLNAVELQGAPWILWIKDLSAQDPYFILPILMGASMWFQQKITPTTVTDPMQQKIFQWLPVVMTLFFLTFPSGLVLYWLVNNIFTIGQQYIINRSYENYKRLKKSEEKK
jgi:YidC/Oxa1 family membrane protein insertase